MQTMFDLKHEYSTSIMNSIEHSLQVPSFQCSSNFEKFNNISMS